MDRYDSRGEGLMRTHHSCRLVFAMVELNVWAHQNSKHLITGDQESQNQHLVTKVSAPNGQGKHCHVPVLRGCQAGSELATFPLSLFAWQEAAPALRYSLSHHLQT